MLKYISKLTHIDRKPTKCYYILCQQILLQGHDGINRAVDGDIVAIEVFPEEEWRKPSDIVLEDKAEDPGDLLEEEAVLLNTAKAVGKKDDEITPTGKVVGIIKRKWRQYCGILLPSKFPGKFIKQNKNC